MHDFDGESFAPIPGFDGYLASRSGRILSTKRGQTRILSIHTMSNGYRACTISTNGYARPVGVHRLVLTAFVGPAAKGMHACHRDGDKANNNISNLYWGTPVENAVDMRRHGRHRNGRKTHCDRGHAFTADNTYIRPGGQRMCLACKRKYENDRYHAGLRKT